MEHESAFSRLQHHHEEHHEQEQEHAGGYEDYIIIWLALLVLTALTVAVATLDLGAFNVVVALFVACCKTYLVLMFFMHVRNEHKTFLWMLMISVFILALVIGFTFIDTLNRVPL